MDLFEPVFQTTFAAIGYNPFFSLNQYSKAQNYAENHLRQRQRHPLRLQKDFTNTSPHRARTLSACRNLKRRKPICPTK